jgi:hypothetical protein
MTCLVDTDVLIDYLRNIEGAADYLDTIGDGSYSVSLRWNSPLAPQTKRT